MVDIEKSHREIHGNKPAVQVTVLSRYLEPHWLRLWSRWSVIEGRLSAGGMSATRCLIPIAQAFPEAHPSPHSVRFDPSRAMCPWARHWTPQPQPPRSLISLCLWGQQPHASTGRGGKYMLSKKMFHRLQTHVSHTRRRTADWWTTSWTVTAVIPDVPCTMDGDTGPASPFKTTIKELYIYIYISPCVGSLFLIGNRMIATSEALTENKTADHSRTAANQLMKDQPNTELHKSFKQYQKLYYFQSIKDPLQTSLETYEME